MFLELTIARETGRIAYSGVLRVSREDQLDGHPYGCRIFGRGRRYRSTYKFHAEIA